MKRREKKEKMIFFAKSVSEPSNPPGELAQHVSKKNPFRTNYSSIFLQKFRIWPLAQGIKSDGFFGRTVLVWAVPGQEVYAELHHSNMYAT